MRDSTHRALLWEQAKGLLRAITASYEHEEELFNDWNLHLENFIMETENNGRGGFA